MIRPIRLSHWAAISSLFALSACTPSLLSFVVPPQVRAGSIFEVAVVGDTDQSLGAGDSGCVFQIPNGFTVAGYKVDAIGGNGGVPSQFNTPLLLSAYTAEPGHYLVSFLGTSNGSSTFPNVGRIALKLFLQAPAASPSSHSLKVALVGGSSGAWTAVAPAGVTQFSAITAAPHRYPMSVVQGVVTDFEIDSPSLPLGASFVPPTSGTPIAMGCVFEDLNLDGDEDLVSTSPSVLKTWQSNPGAAWSSAVIPGSPVYPSYAGQSVAFGDFDGDGFRDFVLVDGRTFFGNGGTAWIPGATLLTGPSMSVAAGDTNGDGRADALLCSSNGAMRLYQGNANRSFTQANNGLPTLGNGTAYGLLLEDLTGDGRLDVYATRSVVPNVWIGDGVGNWTAGSGMPTQGSGSLDFRSAVAGDVTGDGAAEIVLAGNEYAQSPVGVLIYRHQGNGVFGVMAGTGLSTSQLYGSGVAVIDFDDDGRKDVVLGPMHLNNWGPSVPLGQTGLQLWRNTGTGQFQLKANTGLSGAGNVRRIVSGDFTGDGMPDLAISSSVQTLLYVNKRSSPVSRIPHGCSGQSIQAIGTGQIGTSLTATVGNSTGVPIIGLGVTLASVPVCVGCTLGHEWAVISTGSSYTLNIPNSPSLSGVQVGIQGGDVFAVSGCFGIPVSFSDTLVLTIP